MSCLWHPPVFVRPSANAVRGRSHDGVRDVFGLCPSVDDGVTGTVVASDAIDGI